MLLTKHVLHQTIICIYSSVSLFSRYFFCFQIIRQEITFPAVTFCNLNAIQMSKVELAGEDFANVINDIQASSNQSIFGETRKKREVEGSSYKRKLKKKQTILKNLQSASGELSSAETRKESETHYNSNVNPYEVHHRQKRDHLCKDINIFGNMRSLNSFKIDLVHTIKFCLRMIFDLCPRVMRQITIPAVIANYKSFVQWWWWWWWWWFVYFIPP